MTGFRPTLHARRPHPGSDDCLEDKREDRTICSMLNRFFLLSSVDRTQIFVTVLAGTFWFSAVH